jgi:arabinosyltransferase A
VRRSFHGESARRIRSSTGVHRTRLALALALVALVAAGVGAIGPADELRTTYSWPPDDVPESAPSELWYAPLLLARHRPGAISADVPCRLPPALAGSGATVLATARSPSATGGLAVTRDGEELVVAVGDRELDRLPLTGAGREGCAYRLELEDGRWSVEGGRRPEGSAGSLDAMPVVTGLFTSLDMRFGEAPTIGVTTAVHGAKTTVVQKVAWTIAVLAVAAALLLVAGRRPRWPGAALRSAATHAHPVDAVVAVVLLAWWVLAPSFFDDGWVVARQRTFADTGGFSTYYDSLGANLPLSYWLEWGQRRLTEATSALLVLRVPALLCLAATWVLCRWILTRATPASSLTLVALASAFLVGALAWGMTLRPEPVTALLATGVLACTVRFLDRETVAPLAGIAVLFPLALTGHHAGVVALAPVLVAAPRLYAWARPRLATAATLVVSSFAWLVVLAFVGSDLEQRRADAETFRTLGTTAATWRDEFLRYARLSEFPSATPLRRGSVVLIALAVLALLLRRRREGRTLLDLPAAALGVGLVLLVATPSKWPWHFGALIGIAAVAVACETARLRGESTPARGFVALAAALLGAAWMWSPRTGWARVDLRTLDWTPGFETRASLTTLAVALPIVLAAGLGVVALARDRRSTLPAIPGRVAAWTAPVLALPALVFTVVVLAADTARTDGWTLARQNLDTLRGETACGLGDEIEGEGARLAALLEQGDALVLPDLLTYFPCTELPRLRNGVVDPPATVVGPFYGTSWLEVWETSPFRWLLDLYPLEQVELTDPPPDVAVLRVDERIPGARLLPPTSS